MRGVLVCCMMLAAACSPEAKPSFDIVAVKPTAEGDAATLTGWFRLTDRSFRLYPTLTKPADDAKCISGVLLSLAGVPTAEYSDRPMSISGYVFDAKDEASQGAANPCNSTVILQAIDVMVPEPAKP